MYEVQAIIGKRINHITKKVQYQVKWAYFSAEESSWMPEQNLKFVKNLIQKYNQSLEDNLVASEKSKPVKKEAPKLYQIMLSQQQQDDFTLKKGIYEEQENQPQRNMKKMIDSNKSSLNNSNLTELNKKQIHYREGSRQSEKKSKIVEKVLNKKPQILNQKSTVTKKTYQKVQTKIKDNLPPIPPDYQNNRHNYIPVQDLFSQKQQKMKTTMAQKQRDNQSLKKNTFWQKHRSKIQEKEKEDKIAQKYGKNSSRVIPPPPPPRLLGPKLSLKQEIPKSSDPQDNSQKKQLNKSSYQYRYDEVLPSENFVQSQEVENFYKPETSLKKQQKRSQFEVYQVINMEKTAKGFIYLAQTNEGTKWVFRDELVPQYSTKLVQFYEKHLSFND